MKTEAKIFWFIAIFFSIVAPVYWYMAREVIGFVALLFTAILGIMIAGYLQYESSQYDARPEDRHDGEIHEISGNYGFFPPKSIWPFWVAVVVAVIFLGPGLEQWWITLLGIGMGIWALSGWMLEYYRGDYQH